MCSLSAEQQIRESSLFDSEWYQARYSDVPGAGISPERHFLKYGWLIGRDPSPCFSTTAYLARYGDVRRAGVNPLVHYLRNGQKEGREITPVADAPKRTVASKQNSSSESSQPSVSSTNDVEKSSEKAKGQEKGQEKGRLARQLEDTQQQLEHYFKRCQELELQLHS
ncbi:hypothetical protein OM427_25780 [Halomonas sp. 18H]|uniref:hypothetical protein n=1 Tax=Halomonas almeriensis TaxID=308163 RepID=UPI00222F71AF|nr:MULTISPECIES: hypothetical protein [Halomonas]MCW4152927.1 hypothetical protein [Halomonas sp. 18H]MDN3554254.1 hypothetical protein [Halomonas almeriensis]